MNRTAQTYAQLQLVTMLDARWAHDCPPWLQPLRAQMVAEAVRACEVVGVDSDLIDQLIAEAVERNSRIVPYHRPTIDMEV